MSGAAVFAGAVRGAEGAASHRQMASSRRSCRAPVAVILLSTAPRGLPRTEQCPTGPLGREGVGLPRWQGARRAQPHPCRAWTLILSSSRNRTCTWYLLPAQGLPWEIQCQALTDEKERAVIYADVDLPVWLRWVVGSVHGLQDERALSPSWKDERLQKPSGTLIAVQGSGSSR